MATAEIEITELRLVPEPKKMKIAYDIKEMKVGCVLLQATLGADYSAAQKFNTQHWLLAPTPDLRVYEVTSEQLAQLIEKTNKYHAPEEPLIVSRRCARCEDPLLVTVVENETEDDALEGQLTVEEWRVIGGQLFCGGCIRSTEDDELNGNNILDESEAGGVR